MMAGSSLRSFDNSLRKAESRIKNLSSVVLVRRENNLQPHQSDSERNAGDEVTRFAVLPEDKHHSIVSLLAKPG